MNEQTRGARAPLPAVQLLKFGAVGASNTVVDLLLFILFYNGLHFNYLLAHVISYSCGTVNSFVWNRYFTFERRSRLRGRELYRFILLNVCSFLLSLAFIYGFSHLLKLPVIVSKVSSIILTVLVNYVGSKYWCFVER
ncbi:GtrA family protein [Alicyclobacillus fastidiosus]|uniref:GtrA family protein n=1 Tax=Alicyclobacillus fastidiosus TaxID=392011 RepID=A0ABV5AEL6_9BACL|nr:GtrA family protein [Alicyclobacillus fastidiosus]WEH09543.1 GtrA family protein [Alicyclobacillus fastidiosus]